MTIKYNEPYLTGNEIRYIRQSLESGQVTGNGPFTKKVHRFFENRYGFHKCLLTTSCTDALEMAAILLNIGPGDEVIIPSFTFVSTANAFLMRGADIVFADSCLDHPNINPAQIESLITSRTKAVVVVHYAGIACDMERIMSLAQKHQFFVVEDAAQCVDSFYRDRPLGGIGHLGAFSFHGTKNISSGEGGMLVINDEQFAARAEIIWEKGTNRTAFFRGEIDQYGWVDVGSSFSPPEVVSAFLYAQLEQLDDIQQKRIALWDQYARELKPLFEKKKISGPGIPEYATNNGHIFYLVLSSMERRNMLIAYLKERGIQAVFHYLSLHQSPFFADRYRGQKLPMADYFTHGLVRLPLHCALTGSDIEFICGCIKFFFELTPAGND